MISAILNKKIVVEQSTITKNVVGSPVKGWTEYITTDAGVYNPTRSVRFGEDRESLVYTTEFTIRYNNNTKSINNKHRIKYNDSYYKIVQIAEIGNKEGIKFVTIMFEDE